MRRAIDLSPLVKNLIRDLEPLGESMGTRITNSVPGNVIVYADAIVLTQIFQNLLSNAMRFTPGGEIIIGARMLEGMPNAGCGDNGEGIPADRIDRIFDKLETDPDPKKEAPVSASQSSSRRSRPRRGNQRGKLPAKRHHIPFHSPPHRKTGIAIPGTIEHQYSR